MKQLFPIISSLFIISANAQQTNYPFSHTDSTNATSNKIWNVWRDIRNWKQWDKGLQEAILKGEFSLGEKGELIPFGWLITKQTLAVENDKIYFTHDVDFKRLLKKFLGNTLGKNDRAIWPGVLTEIKQIAESK